MNDKVGKDSQDEARQRRRNLRYDPDENAVVAVSYQTEEGTSHRVGLLRDESYTGCSFVINRSVPLHIGQAVRVKAGALPEMDSEVRWVTFLDDKFVKVGVLFEPDKPLPQAAE